MNDPVAFVAGLKLLGAGLAMLGAIGAGVGVGIAASGGVQAMGRNPDASPDHPDQHDPGYGLC